VESLVAEISPRFADLDVPVAGKSASLTEVKSTSSVSTTVASPLVTVQRSAPDAHDVLRSEARAELKKRHYNLCWSYRSNLRESDRNVFEVQHDRLDTSVAV